MTSGYKFKGNKVIIEGEENKIIPKTLPAFPEDGYIAVDSSDNKYKVWSESKGRWIVLGDAEDVVFNNSTNDFVSDDVQDAIEEARDTLIGKIFNQSFHDDGIVVSGRWLSMEDGLGSSDEIPFVVPFDCELIAVTYTNEDPNTDGTIFIQKADYNSGSTDSTELTLSFTNVRTATYSNFTRPSFSAGDKIAVFLENDGTNPDEPRVVLYFQIKDNTLQNLTENWSGDF